MEKPTAEDKSKCRCSMCPTYRQGGLQKTFFCVEGKSDQHPEEMGCLCRTCPVYIRYCYDHKGHFYCRRGAAFPELPPRSEDS